MYSKHAREQLQLIVSLKKIFEKIFVSYEKLKVILVLVKDQRVPQKTSQELK